MKKKVLICINEQFTKYINKILKVFLIESFILFIIIRNLGTFMTLFTVAGLMQKTSFTVSQKMMLFNSLFHLQKTYNLCTKKNWMIQRLIFVTKFMMHTIWLRPSPKVLPIIWDTSRQRFVYVSKIFSERKMEFEHCSAPALYLKA